jgi:carbon storage regulator CsrA
MGLVLSRHAGEKITIGGQIEITIGTVTSSSVHLYIAAPKFIRVRRTEIPDDLEAERPDANDPEGLELGGLVLTRKLLEAVTIGENIIIQVVRIDRSTVGLLIQAPRHVSVDRLELRTEKTWVQTRFFPVRSRVFWVDSTENEVILYTGIVTGWSQSRSGWVVQLRDLVFIRNPDFQSKIGPDSAWQACSQDQPRPQPDALGLCHSESDALTIFSPMAEILPQLYSYPLH